VDSLADDRVIDFCRLAADDAASSARRFVVVVVVIFFLGGISNRSEASIDARTAPLRRRAAAPPSRRARLDARVARSRVRRGVGARERRLDL